MNGNITAQQALSLLKKLSESELPVVKEITQAGDMTITVVTTTLGQMIQDSGVMPKV